MWIAMKCIHLSPMCTKHTAIPWQQEVNVLDPYFTSIYLLSLRCTYMNFIVFTLHRLIAKPHICIHTIAHIYIEPLDLILFDYRCWQYSSRYLDISDKESLSFLGVPTQIQRLVFSLCIYNNIDNSEGLLKVTHFFFNLWNLGRMSKSM